MKDDLFQGWTRGLLVASVDGCNLRITNGT